MVLNGKTKFHVMVTDSINAKCYKRRKLASTTSTTVTILFFTITKKMLARQNFTTGIVQTVKTLQIKETDKQMQYQC
jgi:hypothetical protein